MRFADPAQYVIDDVSNGRFSVHRDVYRDEALFQAELAHIFEGTWVYLCHVSQVKQPYDYFCTQIGRRSVIVSRDGDGALHCFYNTCRHRGATLCQSEAGNRRRHVCRYHGWAYDSAGRNVYIKHEDRGRYPAEFSEADHDLIKVPRFGEYAGFLFASVNPDVPSLEEHLDDGRVLLDLVAEQGPEGMEVVPGRSRYYFNANWKLQMDNGMDPYHLTSTHQTFMQIVQRRAQGESSNDSVESPDFEQRFAMTAGAYSFRNGHSMIWNDQYKPEMQPLWGCIDEVRRKVGEIRARWMLRARNITIFPNLQFNDSTSLVLRSYLPLAVDRTEMQVYSFAPVGEAEEMRTRRVRQHEDFFNSSGMATPDDTAIYADCQQGFDAFPNDYLQGFTRGMDGLLEGPDDEARELGVNPVNSLYGDYLVQGEVAYHAHYRQWVHLLRAGQQRAGRIRAESAVERSQLLIEAEELLAREAWCLDMRQWQSWLDLYLEDAVFWAPAWRNDDEMTEDVNREISLFYFDSRAGLADRVWRIQTGRAAALSPMPRTTHLVSNALLADGESDDAVTVYSAFTCNVFSLRDRSQHSYFGRYEHELLRRDDSWRIARKKIIVMNDYIPAVVEFFCV